MKKAFYIFPLAALLSVASLLCATPAQARGKPVDAFFQRTTQAVDALNEQLEARGRSDLPLLVTTAQNLDNISNSDSVGRLVGELVSSSLVRHGWAVQEVRLRDSLRINDEGEQLLARDIQTLRSLYGADIAVVSTYSDAGRMVYVTLKAVRLADGVIVASHSFITPKPGRR